MANMMLLECCLRVPLSFERNRITGALQLITSTEMPMNTKSITHKLHRLNAEMYCPQTLSFLRTRTRTWERLCHIFLLLCFSLTTGVHSQRTERLERKDHHQMEKFIMRVPPLHEWRYRNNHFTHHWQNISILMIKSLDIKISEFKHVSNIEVLTKKTREDTQIKCNITMPVKYSYGPTSL